VVMRRWPSTMFSPTQPKPQRCRWHPMRGGDSERPARRSCNAADHATGRTRCGNQGAHGPAPCHCGQRQAPSCTCALCCAATRQNFAASSRQRVSAGQRIGVRRGFGDVRKRRVWKLSELSIRCRMRSCVYGYVSFRPRSRNSNS